jgi:hypothetical protein
MILIRSLRPGIFESRDANLHAIHVSIYKTRKSRRGLLGQRRLQVESQEDSSRQLRVFSSP